MKNPFYLLIATLCMSLCVLAHAANRSSTLQAPDTLPADKRGMNLDAPHLAKKIKLGWNIGNTMEATGGETAWGNPIVTNALLKKVKQSGFDAVRIPLAWQQYANPRTHKIDQRWLNRVKQVVQQSVDNDLYVVINIHWDGGWLEDNINGQQISTIKAKQQAYWQQIATTFRDFDQHVLFASANEPAVETKEQMAELLSYHQTFIDTVRATGGRNAYRVLVVQGPVTDIEKTAQLWTQMPIDTVNNRLMVEVHYYTPYNFTLMSEDKSWGDAFYYWGEGNHSPQQPARNATWGEEQTLKHLFKLMHDKFVVNNVPVLLGEFAAMRRSTLSGDNLARNIKSRADYHTTVVEQALHYGLVPFYWDNGQLTNFGMGIFDRQTNTVFDQATLDALLKGVKRAHK